MPRLSIYQTEASRATVNPDLLAELVKFLVLHRDSVLLASETRALTASRHGAATPIGTLFARAIELGKDQVFAYFRIPPRAAPVPEVTTYQHLTFDAKQFAAVDAHLHRALQTTPFADKIITNVTALLTQSGELADQSGFQARAVRDLLSRSYFESDRTWISPAAAQYLCKVYSMAIASALAGPFQLTWPQQQDVATVFAYFFLVRVSDAAAAEATLQTAWKPLGLPQPQQVRDLLDLIKGELAALKATPETMTLDHACALLNKLSISRLQVSRPVLYARLASLAGSDTWTSALALEYPPYLAFAVLKALSGEKINMAYVLKKNGLDRQGDVLVTELLRSPNFFPKL